MSDAAPERHVLTPLTPDNAEDAGEALAAAFFEEGHPPGQWRRVIRGDLALGRLAGECSRVAWVRGRAAGAVIARWCQPSGHARVGYVGSTGVRPQFAGRGLGRALVAAALDALADAGCAVVTLEVAPENARALGLYRSLGFTEVRELLSWELRTAPRRARAAPVAEVLASRPDTQPAFLRRTENLALYARELCGWGAPGVGPLRAGALQREGALFDLWAVDEAALEPTLPAAPSPLALLHEPADGLVGRWLARWPGATPTARVLELRRGLAP